MGGGIFDRPSNQWHHYMGAANGPRQTNQEVHGDPAQAGQPDLGPGGIAYAQAFAAVQAAAAAALARARAREEEPVEDTGVEVGEVVGWRVWLIGLEPTPHLRSAVNRAFIWPPAQPVTADRTGARACEGIHAFKWRDVAWTHATLMALDIPTAFGSVEMWGQIYELEDGWHAEHARVRSIDQIWLVKKRLSLFSMELHNKRRERKTLAVLRRLYEVEGDD